MTHLIIPFRSYTLLNILPAITSSWPLKSDSEAAWWKWIWLHQCFLHWGEKIYQMRGLKLAPKDLASSGKMINPITCLPLAITMQMCRDVDQMGYSFLDDDLCEAQSPPFSHSMHFGYRHDNAAITQMYYSQLNYLQCIQVLLYTNCCIRIWSDPTMPYNMVSPQ